MLYLITSIQKIIILLYEFNKNSNLLVLIDMSSEADKNSKAETPAEKTEEIKVM